jgi:hypothetical protein
VDAGRGLAAAHAAQLIHRDFKPENVLIGRDGRARVTDFGLARANTFAEPEPTIDGADATIAGGGMPGALTLTEAGALAGTPAYMAPEQFQGARADERTDQFNFCAALYKALYRQRPFSSSPGLAVTVGALARAVIAGDLRAPPPSAVPASVHAIVRRGLARDRADRYPSMAALLEALALSLERAPSSRLRRPPVIVALAGGLLLAGSLFGLRVAAGRRALAGGAPLARASSGAPGPMPRASTPAVALVAAPVGEPRRLDTHPAVIRRSRPGRAHFAAHAASLAAVPLVAPPEAARRFGYKLKDPFADPRP